MTINFEKMDGLIPAVIQDIRTMRVLMVGFMNEEALKRTEAEGKVVFFSRTKKRLWMKGETSGNFLLVKEIKVDCDGDTVLIYAEPTGPVCHVGDDTCFKEANEVEEPFLESLEKIIEERKVTAPEGSYTSSLFREGLNRIAQKVGEEAVEVVIAAKDSDLKRFREEVSDLVFHLLVLMREKGIPLKEVTETLKMRHAR